MENNIESKIDINNRLSNFYKLNKVKIFTIIIISFVVVITIFLLKHNNKKNNILIAEKYVEAGLQLSKNNKENARNLYEEIILSKNKFYSILSLNTIIENDLINDNEKVLNYFELLKNLNFSKNKQYFFILKQALYLIKSSKKKEGEQLLKDLIKNSPQLNTLAEEIIKN
jgi:hypothetical protein